MESYIASAWNQSYKRRAAVAAPDLAPIDTQAPSLSGSLAEDAMDVDPEPGASGSGKGKGSPASEAAVAAAWSTLTEAILASALDDNAPPLLSAPPVARAARIVRAAGLSGALFQWYMDLVRQHFHTTGRTELARGMAAFEACGGRKTSASVGSDVSVEGPEDTSGSGGEYVGDHGGEYDAARSPGRDPSRLAASHDSSRLAPSLARKNLAALGSISRSSSSRSLSPFDPTDQKYIDNPVPTHRGSRAAGDASRSHAKGAAAASTSRGRPPRALRPSRLPPAVIILNLIGSWIVLLERPIAALWPGADWTFAFRRVFFAHLYAVLPPRFAAVLACVLRALRRVPGASLPDTASDDASTPVPPLPRLGRAVPVLVTMLDRFDALLHALVAREITARVRAACAADPCGAHRGPLREWLARDVCAWATDLYAVRGFPAASGIAFSHSRGPRPRADIAVLLAPAFARFEHVLDRELAAAHRRRLFDLVVAFPKSAPALADLRAATAQGGAAATAAALRAALARRLDAGTPTRTLLARYIQVIQAARTIDPEDVLLAAVSPGLQAMLRARADTLGEIVGALLSAQPGDAQGQGHDSQRAVDATGHGATPGAATSLAAALAASDRPLLDVAERLPDYDSPTWTPEPRNAPRGFRRDRAADLVQMMVNIYSTRAAFAAELRRALAARLLASSDVRRELAHVRVLRRRFGDAALAGTDVMVTDVRDSQLIDARVQRIARGPLHAVVLSRVCWPALRAGRFRAGPTLRALQSAYAAAYRRVKPTKRLHWLTARGRLSLTLTLEDRVVRVSATPLQASVADLFQTRGTWTEAELVAELEAEDVGGVRNALYFWANEGVLQLGEEGDPAGGAPAPRWTLLETQAQTSTLHAPKVLHDAPETVDNSAEMRIYWQFISAMLTNLGALDTLRIHTMLSTVVPTYKGKTSQDLDVLLNALRSEGKITQTNNKWRLCVQE